MYGLPSSSLKSWVHYLLVSRWYRQSRWIAHVHSTHRVITAVLCPSSQRADRCWRKRGRSCLASNDDVCLPRRDVACVTTWDHGVGSCEPGGDGHEGTTLHVGASGCERNVQLGGLGGCQVNKDSRMYQVICRVGSKIERRMNKSWLFTSYIACPKKNSGRCRQSFRRRTTCCQFRLGLRGSARVAPAIHSRAQLGVKCAS